MDPCALGEGIGTCSVCGEIESRTLGEGGNTWSLDGKMGPWSRDGDDNMCSLKGENDD